MSTLLTTIRNIARFVIIILKLAYVRVAIARERRNNNGPDKPE